MYENCKAGNMTGKHTRRAEWVKRQLEKFAKLEVNTGLAQKETKASLKTDGTFKI